MYKVLRDFRDLQDGGHLYHAGDTFPRIGASVESDRLKELSTTENKAKMALIEFLEDEVKAEVKKTEAEKTQKEKGRRKNVRANTEGDKELLHS